MVPHSLSYQGVDRLAEILRSLEPVRVICQRVSHGAVEYHIRESEAAHRTRHPEFEFVSGESERRRAVPVRVVSPEARDHPGPQLHQHIPAFFIRNVLFDRFQHLGEFISEEYGDYCRRSLARPESVIISGRGDRYPQKILIIIHGFDHRAQKQQELRVIVRGVAGSQQVIASVGREGPVVVFSASVDSVKRLLMQKGSKAVPLRNLFDHLHHQLVLVDGDIYFCIYAGELMLRRSYLIVLCLCEHSELPQLPVELFHEPGDFGLDSSEVMVVKFLSFRRHDAKESPSREPEIRSFVVELARHKEVLLLRAR